MTWSGQEYSGGWLSNEWSWRMQPNMDALLCNSVNKNLYTVICGKSMLWLWVGFIKIVYPADSTNGKKKVMIWKQHEILHPQKNFTWLIWYWPMRETLYKCSQRNVYPKIRHIPSKWLPETISVGFCLFLTLASEKIILPFLWKPISIDQTDPQSAAVGHILFQRPAGQKWSHHPPKAPGLSRMMSLIDGSLWIPIVVKIGC